MPPPYLMGAPFLIDPGGADGAALSGPASLLSGLNWRIPFISSISSTVYSCVFQAGPVSAMMGGPAGASYDVDLRFQGVIETRAYIGGTGDGLYWRIGGEPSPLSDAYNIYLLYIQNVTSPSQGYFTNSGSSGLLNCFAVDYTRTVVIDAGATLTLTAYTLDGHEIYHNLSVAGISDPSQPYPGQWLNMTVTKVVRR